MEISNELKEFAAFVRTRKLDEFVNTNLATLRSFNIPILQKLSHLEEGVLQDMVGKSLHEFLRGLEDGTIFDIIGKRLYAWRSNDIQLVGRDEIVLEDILQGYSAQKMSLLSLLPLYMPKASGSLQLVNALEHYYMEVQRMAIHTLNAIQEQERQKRLDIEQRYKDLFERLGEERDYTDKLIHNAPDAIVVIDELGHIELWNPKAAQVFGWQEANVKGKVLSEVIIPLRYRTKGGQGVNHPVTGTAWLLDRTIEVTALHSTGAEFYVALTISKSVLKGTTRFIAFLRDIDVQKRTEQKLLESEDRYHKMIAEVEDYAILLLNREGIVQNWNRGAEKIKGYREEEIVGKSFKTFYLPEDRERGLPDSLIAEATTKGKAVQEGLRLRKDGSTFWGSIVITALHDNDHNVIGFSKVTRDLTERKNAEDRIFRYTQSLEFQNAELKQFAFVTSHDMKEPLRKIIYNNNYLVGQLGDRATDRERTAMQRSVNAAERMRTLIDDVLAYSQTVEGQEPTETVNLNDVLQQVLSELKEAIDSTGTNVSADVLPDIKGTSHQLAQLFDNLIGNAIKYRHPDRPPHITIRYQKVSEKELGHPEGKHHFHQVSISDNGIGFDAEDAPNLFKLFYRLKERKDIAGSGIGLSICQKIMQSHNGSIHATGTKGKGARFDIYFPV